MSITVKQSCSVDEIMQIGSVTACNRVNVQVEFYFIYFGPNYTTFKSTY